LLPLMFSTYSNPSLRAFAVPPQMRSLGRAAANLLDGLGSRIMAVLRIDDRRPADVEVPACRDLLDALLRTDPDRRD
jgi:hypothetical protein